MAKNKTTETVGHVPDFLNKVADETKRSDSFKIAALFSTTTGLPARMWGPSIVGFGVYHYKYESGHEGNAPLTGFSPRTNAIVLYLAVGFPEREALLSKFGKHKTGKSCIYIKKLADIDQEVLKEMIRASINYVKELYDK